jgi:hypothetical protein
MVLLMAGMVQMEEKVQDFRIGMVMESQTVQAVATVHQMEEEVQDFRTEMAMEYQTVQAVATVPEMEEEVLEMEEKVQDFRTEMAMEYQIVQVVATARQMEEEVLDFLIATATESQTVQMEGEVRDIQIETEIETDLHLQSMGQLLLTGYHLRNDHRTQLTDNRLRQLGQPLHQDIRAVVNVAKSTVQRGAER